MGKGYQCAADEEIARTRTCAPPFASHAVVAVAVDADVHKSEMSALTLLLHTDHVLIVVGAGLQLGDGTILFVVFVAGQLILAFAFVDFTYNDIIWLMVGPAFDNFAAELFQLGAIEVED